MTLETRVATLEGQVAGLLKAFSDLLAQVEAAEGREPYAEPDPCTEAFEEFRRRAAEHERAVGLPAPR